MHMGLLHTLIHGTCITLFEVILPYMEDSKHSCWVGGGLVGEWRAKDATTEVGGNYPTLCIIMAKALHYSTYFAEM